LRGSGRFVASADRLAAAGVDSIPFIAGQWSLREAEARKAAERRDSIPFIAGQWSLPGGPEHPPSRPTRTQSPSLRGSGRFLCQRLAKDDRRATQSPSLRGSGRFCCARVSASARAAGLNPLHCGAVVASRYDLH